ncbi:MAG: sensor histidine kinase [Syntrophobacteraceae bacterium]
MNPSGIVSEFFNKEYVKETHSTRLLRLLMDYWATERDYEIKNELLRKLVLKYAQAERNLTELNQSKNRLMGHVAHDLRNPLASIRGLSEILLDQSSGLLNPQQMELISTIYSASSTMLTLVNDILDISAIENGRIELQISRCSLKELITERMKINRILATQKNITFHSRLANLPDMMFDRNRITQVIDNILGNAIKFSPYGKSIFITLSRQGDNARVSVRDQGAGLPKDALSNLFKDFQTLGTVPTGGEKSTGLGLAIVKKIIDEHKGGVDFKSREGSGTTLSFTLPMEESYGA